MNIRYRRLRERTKELGNHFQKHLRILDKNIPVVLDRLEKHRIGERLDLWRLSQEPADSMYLVRSVARDEREQLQFLRTYYAVQFLQVDLVNVDSLQLSLASGDERFDAYHRFMKSLGYSFIRLVVTYLDFLIQHFVPSAGELEWTLIGVGTLSDQDDIDVVLVDDGSPARDRFNADISRVTNEMLKSATPLHFYLAEKMGGMSYSYTLDEYVTLAERNMDDHVQMSEIVNATHLLGSRALYERFQASVADRYFHRGGQDNLYHEVFVRGMIGEVRSLLLRHQPHDRIHPKNDALRIIKGLAHVFKTIQRVRSRRPSKILDRLSSMNHKQRHNFRRLRRALAFVEGMHILYNTLHMQDDEILTDASGEALERVAKAMGYRRLGVLPAHTQLLVEYYNQVRSTRTVAQVAVEELGAHLHQISAAHRLIRSVQREDAVGRPRQNTAEALIASLDRVPGNRYWYDVIEALDRNDSVVIERFAEDLALLDDEARQAVVSRFASWGRHNVFAWLNFNRLLARRGRERALAVRAELNLAFLERRASSDLQVRLADLWQQTPALFHDYASLMGPDEMVRFRDILSYEALVDDEVRAVVANITSVMRFYSSVSRFFVRNFLAVAEAHTRYLDRLDDPVFLAQLAHGLFGRVPLEPDLKRRKELLVLYFRVQYLRSGVQLLANAPLEQIHREYTEFSDLYFTSLYRLARREAEEEYGKRIETRDRTAIFTAGGRGREEAFDDDLDMIVVSEGLSDAGIEFLQRIVAKMNQQIIRLGIFPQYRMADLLGTFVSPLSQLADHLRSDTQHLYVDMTEFLELRMVEGNTRFEARITHTLVDEIMFNERRDYLLSSLKEEFLDRRRHYKAELVCDQDTVNVKEHPGGLREIELILLAFKVLHRAHEPVNLQLFDVFAERIPEENKAFRALKEQFLFIKRVRHLNRVLITADDQIFPETAELLAPFLEIRDGQTLCQEIRTRMHAVGEIGERLLGEYL